MKWKVRINKKAFITVVQNDDMGFSLGECIPVELASIIRFTYHNDHLIISVYDIQYASISLKTNKVAYWRDEISASEIRNLFGTLISKDPQYGFNKERFLEGVTENDSEVNQTELHTHFLEMLSGEEFLELISDYIDYVPIRDNAVLGKLNKGERVDDFPRMDIASEFQYIASQLSIRIDGQVPFSELEEVSSRRTNIITLAARELAAKMGYDYTNYEDVAKCRAFIYIQMLKKSMECLKESGIKYVEFSYSTANTIKTMHDHFSKHPKEIEGIDFNILFSYSRNTNTNSKADKAIKSFEELVRDGYVKGFDLMGQEHGFTDADLNDLSDSKNFISVVNNVLRILDNRIDMVLRLHAGENEVSRENPLASLKVIDKLVTTYGYIPPQIRIGHGLHFFEKELGKYIENPEYEMLLKKYNVIVEINATSNFTLSNISNFEDIPYDWYTKHHIPMVLATDGGGMYLTTPEQERVIAAIFGGRDVLENVRRTERSFLRR